MTHSYMWGYDVWQRPRQRCECHDCTQARARMTPGIWHVPDSYLHNAGSVAAIGQTSDLAHSTDRGYIDDIIGTSKHQ